MKRQTNILRIACHLRLNTLWSFLIEMPSSIREPIASILAFKNFDFNIPSIKLVANATAGSRQAAPLPTTFALSIPLQILLRFMDIATPSDGPCAVGARRVLNGSKLCKGSVMNSFKTPVSVLPNVPFHFTAKQ